MAPSGYNHQPYVFVVVTDPQIRAKIAKAAVYGKFISDAGACVAVFCKKDEETMTEDACAATENIIIAAQAYGLGTCWVNAKANDSYNKTLPGDIKNLLGCPADYELMTLIAVGYPDEVKKTPKKPFNEVLRWNKF